MFEIDPEPEYNDDGIVVVVDDDDDDDGVLVWDILLRICWGNIPVRSLFFDNNEGGWELFDELVTVVVTDDIGRVDVDVTIESFVLDIVVVPFDICLDGCFVCGESICCCLDAVVLLLVVVVDVDGTVFCETIAEYWRTGNVVALVVTGYVKCGGALVESIDAEDGADGNIDFVDDNKLGDCWEVFGEVTCVTEELFAPEFDLHKNWKSKLMIRRRRIRRNVF